MGRISRYLVPWLKVIVSQGVVLAVLVLMREHLPQMGPVVAIAMLLGQGAAAAVIGYLMGLPKIWLPSQVLLPLAIVTMPFLPGWIFPVAFVLLALIYWNSASEQVPLYLTNRRTFEAVGRLVEEAGVKSFVDLGSGTGGLVAHIAKGHPQVRSLGVETAPLVYLFSRLSVATRRLPNAQIVYRSLWDEDLSSHDLVYCFLSPVPMPKVYEKAKREMRPGTLLVSNSFVVPGIEPQQIVDVEDGRKTRLYLYRM